MKYIYQKVSKHLLILVVLVTLINSISNAQQDPMFTQYMFNTLSINPAYAGTRDALNILALSRHQWIGLEGAPTTQTLVVHTPIKRKNIGIGGTVITDKIGPIQQNFVYFDFAYHLPISKTATLSMGLKGGFKLFSGKFTDLELTQHGDAAFAEDPKLEFMPNFGAGLYYYTPKYYIGLSAPKLLNNLLDSNNETEVTSIGNEERHYFFIAGYVFDKNPNVVFKPSILTKYVKGSPVSFDVTANFLLYQKLWLGAMYRVGDSFGFLTQYLISNQLSIGYAFDLTTSKLRSYNTGTHEIMISYDLSFTKKKFKSPRYF